MSYFLIAATGTFKPKLPWLQEYCPDGDATAASPAFRLGHRAGLPVRQHSEAI